MSETGPLARGLAGDCMVESAEGPVAMRDTPNKGFAVLTRLPSGQLGFRQLIKVVEKGPVPLVRVDFAPGPRGGGRPGPGSSPPGRGRGPGGGPRPGGRAGPPF